jgi:hypothetical protein
MLITCTWWTRNHIVRNPFFFLPLLDLTAGVKPRHTRLLHAPLLCPPSVGAPPLPTASGSLHMDPSITTASGSPQLRARCFHYRCQHVSCSLFVAFFACKIVSFVLLEFLSSILLKNPNFLVIGFCNFFIQNIYIFFPTNCCC